MNKKIKRIILNHLDKIYSSSVRISKSFDQNAISPFILKEIIGLAKIKKTKENRELHEFIGKYNIMLDTLYKGCMSYIKKIQAEKVSFVYLKLSINIMKTEIKKL